MGETEVRVDEVQKRLQEEIFKDRVDTKKAAGRALGTIQEIIVWFLLETHDLGVRTLLEYQLPEYGSNDILHNVEFSVHPLRSIDSLPLKGTKNLSLRLPNKIINQHSKQKENLVSRVNVLETHRQFGRKVRLVNRCFVKNRVDWDYEEVYLGRYKNQNEGELVTISKTPIAFIESKRVGLEEGTTTGPQTIEKAKQASYVALRSSKLQKIFHSSGVKGVIEMPDGKTIIDSYEKLWNDLIKKGETEMLRGVIRSIIFLSDHINWYVKGVEKKDLRILKQSYDWTIWIEDKGLAGFVEEFLLTDGVVRDVFYKNYVERKKGGALFTKNRLDDEVYSILFDFFQKNAKKIKETWLKVLTPKDRTFDDLVKELCMVLNIYETKKN